MRELFGEGEGEVLTSQLLKEVQKKWDVYHINVNDWTSDNYGSPSKWRGLINDDHFALSESMESKEIGNLLSTIIVGSYKKNVGSKATVGGNTQHQL